MIDKTIEELKQIKQTLEELQEQYNYTVEQLVIYEKAFKLACEELVSCKKEFMKNYNFTAENEMDAFLDLANRS